MGQLIVVTPPTYDRLVHFEDIVRTSEEVAKTRSRRAKIAALSDALRRTPPEQLSSVVPWLSGELRQGRIGVGYAAAAAADIASAERSSLTLVEVDAALDRIAAVSGGGSQERRRSEIAALLAMATAGEQEYLIALMTGDLRQGALAGVLVDAIAEAASVPAGSVRRAAMMGASLAEVAGSALAGGEQALAGFGLVVGRPLQPMLASSARSAREALPAGTHAAVEAKLDGARIQVHVGPGGVRVFTRNLRDVTDALPEVVAAMATFDVASMVLDGEVVAFDADGRPRPFQETMSRFGRSLGVPAMAVDVPMTPVIFDCLHLDGEDLIDLPLIERWERLDAVAPAGLLVERIETADADEAAEFLAAVLAAGHEGVVVKARDSTYQAGRRGGSWIKVKPVHTLDLVVLAAEWGSGRRRGRLSNLHLGAADGAGGYVMLGKTFKGLTDEILEWQTARFLELETGREGHVVVVRPEQVVEIAFDGVQASTRYPGGVTLRFARVKGYRPDKRPDEADTIDTVRAIHQGRRLPT
ncbi:ATP-dependent DNA ligase [bacterium]|nr:ATP-dependent DNA ligase [bacterium]